MAASPLVLASSRTDAQALAEARAGLRPRLDYLAVAEALEADVLDTRASDGMPGWQRRVERALASDIRQARTAWRRRGLYSAFLSTSEKVGLPLALLARGRPGPAHVLIGHHLTSARKRQLHRWTGLLRHGFSDIICLSRSQESFLREEVGIPAGRVHRVFDNVDQEFFCPRGEEARGDYLLAVGREGRDYPTLIRAAAALGLPLTIVASSLWSRRGLSVDDRDLPANVTVRRDFVSYPELRALYAGARLVVVPLFDLDYAAGVNGVLEAMAMGRATVVTRTRGLSDYVSDGVTNRLAPPGEAEALAAAIRSLWGDGAARAAMGAAARARVEAEMGLDAYAARVAAVVRDAAAGGRP